MASIFSKGVSVIERASNSGRKVRINALGYLVAVGEGVGNTALVCTKDAIKICQYIKRNSLCFISDGSELAELIAQLTQ